MKLSLLLVRTDKNSALQSLADEYCSKIRRWVPFEVIEVKSPSLGREDAEYKKQQEEKNLLKAIKPDDWVVLFDEGGREFDSIQWSRHQQRALESGKSRVVFVIGGAFGVGDQLRGRANALWSLSKLTLNHQVANLVVLEQIFRGLMIQKNIPYHNS